MCLDSPRKGSDEHEPTKWSEKSDLAHYKDSFIPPPFTFKELKAAIPPEFLERNTMKSFYHLILNISICSALFYSATFIDPYTSHFSTLQVTCWILYWILQGIHVGGLWVIAHECGHYGFSPSKAVNDIVGFCIHTVLLVPYFSWQISHNHHHVNAGHLTKDQFPVGRLVRSKHSEEKKESDGEIELSPWREAWMDSPLRPTILVIVALLFGYPAYLLGNFGGRQYDRFTNHFLPWTPMFKDSQRKQVTLSVLGVLAVWGVLGYIVHLTSIWTISKYYFVPYLVVNVLLVVSTFLHHSDVYLPHYSDESWTFVRGALSTVDRNNGRYLNWALHHINDTHVIHHLFPQMSHYNAVKATPYLKAKLGKYYIEEKTPVIKALWRSVGQCNFIDVTGTIEFYRRK